VHPKYDELAGVLACPALRICPNRQMRP
jgi:hypothetical protein